MEGRSPSVFSVSSGSSEKTKINPGDTPCWVSNPKTPNQRIAIKIISEPTQTFPLGQGCERCIRVKRTCSVREGFGRCAVCTSVGASKAECVFKGSEENRRDHETIRRPIFHPPPQGSIQHPRRSDSVRLSRGRPNYAQDDFMLSDSDVEILTSQPSRRSLRIAIADSLDETSRDFQEYGREEDYEDYLDQKVEDIVSIEATPRFEPGMKRKRTTPLSDSKPGLLLEREKDRKPRVFDIANTESKPKRLASVCDSTPISTPLTPGASAAGTSIENSDSHGGIPAAEILNELLAVETGASPATLLRHLVRENMRQERNVVDLQRMNAELRERIRSIESDIGRSRQGA